MRKNILLLLTVFVLVLTGCTGASGGESRDFNYPGMKWGTSLDKVLKEKGTPDIRTDEMAVPEGQEPPQVIDFYYYGQPILEKYTATEQFLFDGENKLEGVIDLVDVGELDADGTNRDAILKTIKDTHMDVRAQFTELYGEPAAEYTAYRQDDAYVTDELLDLDKEDAVICATRWDGDNYRYIYIISFLNSLEMDIRYIPHTKEEVEAAAAREQQEQAGDAAGEATDEATEATQ